MGVITKTKNNDGKTVSIIGKTVTSDSSSNNSRDYSNTVINIPKELEVNGEILPVIEIDSGAFQGSGLIDVIMSEGLLYIHDYAFAGNQLIRAIIPNSVIEVGNYAFAYNEIASEPTIDPINILQDKFTGHFNNIDNEGNISQPVSTIDLKDHIFIISSMGNHVIEDIGANPEQPEDNNDEDVNNKEGLMNPIEPRKPIEGEEIAIDSAEELAKIGTDYPLNGKYILTSGIDLSSFDNWVPIGNSSTPFTGSFNGNGYKITGLTINGSNFVGLFGYTERATVSNIALEDINVTGTGSWVGGLVGTAYDGTEISNSYTTGEVIGTVQVGGLVGWASINATISNSYATGLVTGTERVGGLVGRTHYSTIENSYATGTVEGSGDNVGGLVGGASGSTIENSYATGLVTGSGNHVGGLVGYANGSTISNSYATGSVAGTSYFVGGLVGWANSTITNSYWDKETTGQPTSSGGGAGRTTVEMKEQATYSGWNFVNVWKIDEGKDYPKLR